MKYGNFLLFLCFFQEVVFCSAKNNRTIVSSYRSEKDATFKWYILRFQDCSPEAYLIMTQQHPDWLQYELKTCEFNRIDEQSIVTQFADLILRREKRCFNKDHEVVSYRLWYGFRTQQEAQAYAMGSK